jgi:hypothetical protein
MPLIRYKDRELIRVSRFTAPPGLAVELALLERRGQRWVVYLFHSPGAVDGIWTLVLQEERIARQWHGRMAMEGKWVADREAVLLNEEGFEGLFNLEGRKIPKDVFDDEDEGGDVHPAVGRNPLGGDWE